ncbi:hypothetical protein ACNJFJ_21050 [Mycobacterium tuberculosis]
MILTMIVALAAQNVDPSQAPVKAPATYAQLMSARVPVTAEDIVDRPYRLIARVERNVRKATIFSKDSSQEKLENELWERGKKVGADAVINARFGGARLVLMSWGANKVTGDAVHFLTDDEIAARPATGTE